MPPIRTVLRTAPDVSLIEQDDFEIDLTVFRLAMAEEFRLFTLGVLAASVPGSPATYSDRSREATLRARAWASSGVAPSMSAPR